MFQGRWGIFPAADNNGNIPVWPGALLGVDGRDVVRGGRAAGVGGLADGRRRARCRVGWLLGVCRGSSGGGKFGGGGAGGGSTAASAAKGEETRGDVRRREEMRGRDGGR